MSSCPSCQTLGEEIQVDGFTIYICYNCKAIWYDIQDTNGKTYQVELINKTPMNKEQVVQAVKGIIAYLEHINSAKGG